MKTNTSKSNLKVGSSVLATNSAEAVKALQKTRLTQGLQEQPDVQIKASVKDSSSKTKVIIHVPENVKSFLERNS